MHKVVAINGSPRMEKGNTALLLDAFTRGLKEYGCEVDIQYASRLKIEPCACGRMYCWNDKKGECCFQDDMQTLYTKLKNAAILILATPIYIPMPGAMQNFLNRLCPLLEPELKTRDGRTRVRFRDDVNIHKIVLVATGGWWELANLDRLVLIVQEIAEDAGVEFAGALLRPHAHSMRSSGKVTLDGEAVLAAAKLAGYQLIVDGKMNPDTLTQISRPLVPQEQEPTQLNP